MNEYRLSNKDALTINSSGGQLMKWRVKDKFIKTSTIDSRSLNPKFMYESYAEVIASYLGKMMGFGILDYKLCRVNINNSISCIACESELFNSSNESYISIAKIMMNGTISTYYINDINGLYGILSSLCGIKGFREYLIQSLVLDYIILNSDRHYGNLGLIVNNRGEYRVAPIFDNGTSMFSDKYVESMSYGADLSIYITAKPFNRNFDIQIKQVLKYTNSRDEVLRYLGKINIQYVNKKIDSMIKVGLSEHRAKFIKSMLKDRIERLRALVKEF